MDDCSYPNLYSNEYIHSKQIEFPQVLSKYKEISKDIVLRNSNDEFYNKNQFTDDDNDLYDWIIINNDDDNNKYYKEGFILCYFPDNNKNEKIKFQSHYISLEDDYLICYQAKDSGYQLKYKKLYLQGAIIINAQSYTKKKFSFRISCIGESNICYFLCNNNNEYNEWFSIISNVINSFNSDIKHENIIQNNNTSNNSLLLDIEVENEFNTFINMDNNHLNTNLLSNEELKWLDKNLEKHLSKHPECSGTIISDHIEMILRCDEHPLSKFYNNAITKWKDEHYFIVYTTTDEDILKSSVLIVKNIIKCIVNESLDYYSEQLNAFPKSIHYCTSAVEHILFEDLFDYLFSMYKLCYKQDDSIYLLKIQEFSSIIPAHFGINTDFWLLNDICHKIPYQDAINTFKKIRDLKTPTEKLKCIKATGDAIYKCISKYYEKYEPDKHISLSGDDLLPLFTYTVIRSQIPHGYSEFRFIEDFLNPIFCSGEIHYFFVTFSTSLSLISIISEDTLGNWFKQDFEDNDNCDNDKSQKTKKKKRSRTSSLIEVELNNESNISTNTGDSKAFLSWASALIRK